MSRLHRILPAFLIAILAVGPVSAATAGPAAQTIAQTGSPASVNSTITGSVNDSQGAPVAGAQLLMVGPASYDATSDAKGHFTITGVKAGIYSFAVTKPGFSPTVQEEFVVAAGQSQTLAVVMQVPTLTSLRQIGSVTTTSRGRINNSTAAVSNIAAATYADQSQPQVMRVLNETPGIVASLPQTGANGAVPGAITFPNIRGALSFESASLIDGHPVSVGTFGDYVTTFLNSHVLGGTEVVKGPGAIVPNTNYAIGGTVNFRSLEPTFKPHASLEYGLDNWSGYDFSASYTGTTTNGRLGYAAVYAANQLIGPVNGYQTNFSNGLSGAYLGSPSAGTAIGFGRRGLPVPGTTSTIFNASTPVVACCQPINGTYQNNSELLKLRYKLSPVTSVTASYLGSQTTASQLGNTSSLIAGVFAPGAGYNGSATPGAMNFFAGFPGAGEPEINNEPIFQAEIHTSLNRDSILARAYVATIQRLIYEGNADPTQPQALNVTLNGTGTVGGRATVFNNVSGPVNFFNYFNQTENDQLRGQSFQYDHFFGNTDNTLTFSYDSTYSTTTSFSVLPAGCVFTFSCAPGAQFGYSVNIPTGSSQRFGTAMLRGNFSVGPKVKVSLAEYANTYRSTVATAGPAAGPSLPSGAGDTFGTFTSNHNDQRVAVEYRPTSQLALRGSAGTAIAPPYLFLLTSLPSAPTYSSSAAAYTQSVKSPNLLPETAFGYDFGGDYRFKDGLTVLSGDVYSTNLYNQFITQTINTGTTYNDKRNGVAPLFTTQPVNLDQARYEGIELALSRNPVIGWGFTLQGALQRAYIPGVPPCFYSTVIVKGVPTCTGFNTNLAIIPGTNFSGGGLGYNGVSNQNVPYSQGYGEIRYNLPNRGLFLGGMTYYGPNNSLNVRPFFVENASFRMPVGEQTWVQLSGDNLTNQYSGLFPIQGTGIPVPLANGQLGATNANVLGPRTIRLTITREFGKP